MTSAPSRIPPPSSVARHPVLLLGQQQGVAHRTADGEADRVVEVGIGEGLDEAVGGPGRVGPDQDGMDDQCGVVALFVAECVLGRDGPDHLLEQLEVVVGVIWGGVARAQHGAQWLFGVVTPRSQGVEPEAVLVLCTSQIGRTGLSWIVMGQAFGQWLNDQRSAENVGMPRWTLVERAVIWSSWSSFWRAPARLIWRPSASPSHPSVLASAMRAIRLSRTSMSRPRWVTSGRNSGHRTQACSWMHGVA